MADEKNIIVKYEMRNDGHSIDVMALTRGLGEYCGLLQYFSGEIRSDAKLNIRVEVLSPGSFEVGLKLFEIGQGVLGTVVSNNLTDPLANILDMFKQFIELKNLLGSEKADAVTVGENSTVNIVKGNQVINVRDAVFNIYTGSGKPTEFLQTGSLALLSDTYVEGMKVQESNTSQRENIICLNKEQIGRMTSPNAYLQEETRLITVSDATLLLTSPNLEFRGVWRFDYNGHKISATFEDKDFIKAVSDGLLQFRSKDIFTVDMTVLQTQSPGSPCWEDKEHVVTKVKSINNMRDMAAKQ